MSNPNQKAQSEKTAEKMALFSVLKEQMKLESATDEERAAKRKESRAKIFLQSETSQQTTSNPEITKKERAIVYNSKK